MSPSHRQVFSHLHRSICSSPSLSWKAAAGPCTDAGPLRESHAMLQVHHWIRMWIFSRIPTLVFCMPMTMVVAWVSFVVDPPTSTPTFFRPCSNDPPPRDPRGCFFFSFVPSGPGLSPKVPHRPRPYIPRRHRWMALLCSTPAPPHHTDTDSRGKGLFTCSGGANSTPPRPLQTCPACASATLVRGWGRGVRPFSTPSPEESRQDAVLVDIPSRTGPSPSRPSVHPSRSFH